MSFNDRKKLGTLVLAGHGTPQEFALPLNTGGQRLPLTILEVGLNHSDVLQSERPREWKWADPSLDKVRGDLMKLKLEAEILHRHLARGWTDEKTLIRMWCCNLGKPRRVIKTLSRFLESCFLEADSS